MPICSELVNTTILKKDYMFFTRNILNKYPNKCQILTKKKFEIYCVKQMLEKSVTNTYATRENF